MSLNVSIALGLAIQSAQSPPAWPPDSATLERTLPPSAQFEAAYAVTTASPFVVTFFSVSHPDGRLTWHARREDLTEAPPNRESWASGASCPALYATLDWLSDIQPPALAINGLKRLPDDARPYSMRPMRGPVADGSTYWLSGRGWGYDYSLVYVSAVTTSGYIADWAEATTHHLASCWSAQVPRLD